MIINLRTGLHCIIKYLQDHPNNDSLKMQIDILRYYLQGLIITCFAQGAVEVNPSVVKSVEIGIDSSEEWKKVFELGVKTLDEHVPKAVCLLNCYDLDGLFLSLK